MINCHEKKLIDKTGASLGRWRFIRKCSIKILLTAIISFGVISSNIALADTPVTLFRSFAGNINITGTAGTLRTAPDGTDSCSVTNSGSMQLLGVPTGSTIVAAYLYWAGSGGDPAGGAAADYNVTFNGNNVTADRIYTASYNNAGNILYFFGGVKDVTSLITGNATYTFSNLAVQNANVSGGGTYCSSAAVLSAYALVVVYSNPGETLHVVNLWEGFQTYRGGSITLTPTNFIIPNPVPANSARHLVLTWEGDSGNSVDLNGFTENLTLCAPTPCTGTPLSDAYNPINNQFNSTVDIPPNGPFSGINTSWGVDLDLYDITSYLHAGDASAQAVYSSGADLVILSNQTMSIPNVIVADLAITKSHSGNFLIGSNGFYTLNVTNNGPSSTSGTTTVTDTLPTGLTYSSATGTGWSCSAVGQTVTCTNATILASGASAPAITLTVSVGAAASPSVTNTATVTGGAFDNVAGNNTSSDVTVIGVNLSTSTKTVVDLDGGDTLAGDTLQYTITINETNGAMASGVSVSDPIDANLTNVTPVSCGGGGTCSYTAPDFNCSGITVPASGSVMIVYTANISGSAAPGTTINNTATITPTLGTGATPAAPVVTVAGNTSGTGTKLLYLYDGTSTPAWKLSRTPNTTSANYATIANGGSRLWTMNPAAAAAITISPTVSATVPVILYLRRNNTTNARNIRVNLQCSSGGTILTQTQNLTLNNTITAYTFNLPLGANLTCGQNNTWNLTVSQTSGTDSTRVYPQSGGNPSRVNLPSTTVIKVDSIDFYNGAYPLGSAITSIAPGSTVYIRAVVSDPFGSYDIVNAPTITIKNPSGTTIVPATAMNYKVTGTETPSLTKTYEYSYVVPFSPTGNWSVSVTATEGTEGTVTNTAYATMPVVSTLASVSILKSANRVTTNSGDIITYSILVTNTGNGPATSVSIDDNLGSFIQWGLNSYPGGAFELVQGGTPSGLTLGTAVYYSGASVYTPVSEGGGAPVNFDGNVTRFQLPLTGTMNASGASCTINYKVRVK